MTDRTALEQLTPDNSVLLFIDHQPQMAFGVQSIDRQVLKNNVVALAKAAGWPLEKVWVMQEGTTPEALAARWPWVADYAAKLGINASHRLHVLAWGDTRGH